MLLDPSVAADQERLALIKRLNRTERPLYGGQSITRGRFSVGTSVPNGGSNQHSLFKQGSAAATIYASLGTLGVLVEDANDTEVGYALTALHVLENYKGETLEHGAPIFQIPPGRRSMKPSNHIGWLIASAPSLDVALIGLRPGRRWRPEIQVSPIASVTTKGSARILPRAVEPGPAVPQDPAPTEAPWWNGAFDAKQLARTALPGNGVAIRKTGRRTGHTTGRAYALALAHKNPPFSRIVEPTPPDSRLDEGRDLWADLIAFYAAITDPAGAPLAPDDKRYNPPRYLCVPDTDGLGPGVVSFAQKSDSGSAILDADDRVVAILSHSFLYPPAVATTWVGAVAVPVDFALRLLEIDFYKTWYEPTNPAPGLKLPSLRVPNVASSAPAPERRVPGDAYVNTSSWPDWLKRVPSGTLHWS